MLFRRNLSLIVVIQVDNGCGVRSRSNVDKPTVGTLVTDVTILRQRSDIVACRLNAITARRESFTLSARITWTQVSQI